MSRSSSESNVQARLSSADMQELANMEIAPDFRNVISNASQPYDSDPSNVDSSKSESIQLTSASERVATESSTRNSRLNLDGIPSTPELCALQAILPKQVTNPLFSHTGLHL